MLNEQGLPQTYREIMIGVKLTLRKFNQMDENTWNIFCNKPKNIPRSDLE